MSAVASDLLNFWFEDEEDFPMKNDRRRILAAMAAAAVLPSVVHAQARGSRKIVLGQSVPLTGAGDQIGLAFAAGSKLYFDAFNGAKNNPGWTFELRQVDDSYDPAKAAANARKLIADGADLLFGFVGTGSAESAAAVAREQGTVLFAPFAASDAAKGANSTVPCSRATAAAVSALPVPTNPNSRSAPSASSFFALAAALAGS